MDGCWKPTFARGWCRAHYARWHRLGDVQADKPFRKIEKQGTECSVEGCGRKSAAKGWCRGHYTRWHVHGDLRAEEPLLAPGPKPKQECSVEGCTHPASTRGWCSSHYGRWHTHGDVLADVPLLAEGVGYKIIRAPTHPLATSEGRLAEHRKVLYDAIGDGQHPCHWCQEPVRWLRPWEAEPDALVVDHLDGEVRNNDRENLVPACFRCNAQRGSAGNPLDWVPKHLRKR